MISQVSSGNEDQIPKEMAYDVHENIYMIHILLNFVELKLVQLQAKDHLSFFLCSFSFLCYVCVVSLQIDPNDLKLLGVGALVVRELSSSFNNTPVGLGGRTWVN